MTFRPLNRREPAFAFAVWKVESLLDNRGLWDNIVVALKDRETSVECGFIFGSPDTAAMKCVDWAASQGILTGIESFLEKHFLTPERVIRHGSSYFSPLQQPGLGWEPAFSITPDVFIPNFADRFYDVLQHYRTNKDKCEACFLEANFFPEVVNPKVLPFSPEAWVVDIFCGDRPANRERCSGLTDEMRTIYLTEAEPPRLGSPHLPDCKAPAHDWKKMYYSDASVYDALASVKQFVDPMATLDFWLGIS